MSINTYCNFCCNSSKHICIFFYVAAKPNVLDRLTFGEAKSAGPFLDGCNVNLSWIFLSIVCFSFNFNFAIIVLSLQIYLAGFVTSVRDKLNRILNIGGATRLDDISTISDAVTHVVVGDENKASAELKAIKSRGLWYVVMPDE